MTRTNVMRRAWTLYKEANCTTRYEFGLALKAAWNQIRQEENARNMNTYIIDGKAYYGTKDAFMAAFLSKYPTGSIAIGQFWNSAKITFEAGGKEYFYGKAGWQTRLGINVESFRKAA